jgi:hypothetical protein
MSNYEINLSQHHMWQPLGMQKRPACNGKKALALETGLGWGVHSSAICVVWQCENALVTGIDKTVVRCNALHCLVIQNTWNEACPLT